MIKPMSRSNAWQALYLTKQGTFGFLTTPINNIKKNNNLPKGNEPSIIVIGNVRYKSNFKNENLQNK